MAKGFKVAVVGAAGGIGQPLSLLLKLNPKVHRLSLYDVVPLVTGVAVDISHLDTPANVTSNFGKEGGALEAALKDADVVVIPAGVPRKPGMTRDDLFSINAGIVRGIAEAAATACPNALIAVISNPVNSMVPVFVEALAKRGIDASKRVFGVTTLDLIRANRFASVAKGSCPLETRVPVIAGHSGNTIIPLLSQTTPAASFTEEEIVALTSRIQNAGTEVVDAKAGAGSATLSTAQAGAQFVDSLLRGLLGEANVLDYAYVKSTVVPGVDYFSSQILLGPNGAEEIRGFGTLTAYEQKILDDCIPSLQQNISDGVTFVNK